MKKILLVLMVMLLTGCYNGTINIAHNAIKQDLKDPYSAQFAHDTVVKVNYGGEDAVVVCGTINAKNGFGAYVGDKLYFSITKRIISHCE